MAVVKVFDVNGTKTLICFDALANVPYLPVEEDPCEPESEPEEED